MVDENVMVGPLNLHEYEEAARALLPQSAFDYIHGGSGDEVTLRANRRAFDRWRLLPRVLSGNGEPSTETTVLGRRISLPVMIAPVGFHRLVHPEGELATARAADRAGTMYVCSTAATYPLEDIGAHAGQWWFQLYIFQDRAITIDLVQRAAAAGASALVVTVDTPVLGRREADERNRFSLPEGVGWANLMGTTFAEMHAAGSGSGLAAYTSASFDRMVSWKDIEWLRDLTDLPLILKGILAPDDARQAFDLGSRAIVVSNHGGRQLDCAVASLDALPAVVDAVGGRGEVYLDGGVRRGTDVLRVLALGARAVLLGRPILWSLAVNGEAGVLQLLELLQTELARDMALCGCANVGDITRALVVPSGPLGVQQHRD